MITKQKNPPPKKPMAWYRMDLHLHTPASADFRDMGITYLQFLQKAESRGLDIIAFTDHNSVAGWSHMYDEVETLLTLDKRGRLTDEEKHLLSEYRRLSEKLMVLPGFEVTATLGFHVLGIFPTGTSVRKLEHILLDLNIPEDKLELGVGEVGSTSDVLTVYREIADAGGIAIAAHANSTHGVALQGFDFGGQTKIAYTQDKNLHALEVTDLESISRRRTANFFNGSKPEYPRRLHCIQGSDAHHLDHDARDKSEPWGVGDRVTEVYLQDLTFDALKELFLGDDFSRTRPARAWGVAPPQPVFDAVKAARKQGPNLVQSFHENFSGKLGRLAAIIADVVAMANTNGGTIYVGVNASPKPPVIGIEKPEEAIAILKKELQKATTPPIGATMDVVQSEGKNVIEIKVPKGIETPYVLGTGQIYVRQESETSLAMRDEIVRLVLAAHKPGAVVPPAVAVQPTAAPVPSLAPVPTPIKPAVPVRPAPRPAPARPVIRRPIQTPVSVPSAPVAPAQVEVVPAPTPVPVVEAPLAPVPVVEVTPAVAPAEEAPVVPSATKVPSAPEVVAVPGVPEAPARPARRRKPKAKPAEVEVAPVAPEAAPVEQVPAVAEAPAKPKRKRVGKVAAETAPVAVEEAPAVLEEPKPKRRRVAKKKAVVEEAPSVPESVEVAEVPAVPSVPEPEAPALYAEPPRTGVEIMAVENRDGVLTYTVRDLRNNNVVHNVTRFSARHLWKYAITEKEDHPLTEADITWQGNLGLWKTYKRAGAKRYNLVQRDSEGNIHVYYGVTEDGIHGEWRAFLEGE